MSGIHLIGDMVPVLPETDRNDFDGNLVRRVCNVRVDASQGKDAVTYGIAVRRRILPNHPVQVDPSDWESVLTDSFRWYQVEAFSYVRGEYPGKPGSVGDVPFLTFQAVWDQHEAFEQYVSVHAILSGMCKGFGLYDSVLPVAIGYRMHEEGNGLPFANWQTVRRMQHSLMKFVQEGW